MYSVQYNFDLAGILRVFGRLPATTMRHAMMVLVEHDMEDKDEKWKAQKVLDVVLKAINLKMSESRYISPQKREIIKGLTDAIRATNTQDKKQLIINFEEEQAVIKKKNYELLNDN